MRSVRLIVRGSRRLRYGGKKKFSWKVTVNGEPIAFDGRQDFNNAADAEKIATKLLKGEFGDFELVRIGTARDTGGR